MRGPRREPLATCPRRKSSLLAYKRSLSRPTFPPSRYTLSFFLPEFYIHVTFGCLEHLKSTPYFRKVSRA